MIRVYTGIDLVKIYYNCNNQLIYHYVIIKLLAYFMPIKDQEKKFLRR